MMGIESDIFFHRVVFELYTSKIEKIFDHSQANVPAIHQENFSNVVFVIVAMTSRLFLRTLDRLNTARGKNVTVL